jgi:lipopolysaccharide export system permease protein
MALGNMSENYEFAAAKSASISLMRLMRPLIILTLIISMLNFLSLNYVFPYATLKQKNLTNNIKKKTPALALISGSFNSEIPNYQIKFDEKYGEEKNLLKKVLIYDLSSKKGNKKIITAEKGKIISEEGSKYMTLVLYDGYYHEEHIPKRRSVKSIKKMPASNATFNEYTFNIDISKFTDGDLDDEKYTKSYNMLSLGQLKDTIPAMKLSYDEYLTSKSKSIYIKINAKELYKQEDSLSLIKFKPEVLNNFNLCGKVSVLNSSINNLIN